MNIKSTLLLLTCSLFVGCGTLLQHPPATNDSKSVSAIFGEWKVTKFSGQVPPKPIHLIVSKDPSGKFSYFTVSGKDKEPFELKIFPVHGGFLVSRNIRPLTNDDSSNSHSPINKNDLKPLWQPAFITIEDTGELFVHRLPQAIFKDAIKEDQLEGEVKPDHLYENTERVEMSSSAHTLKTFLLNEIDRSALESKIPFLVLKKIKK